MSAFHPLLGPVDRLIETSCALVALKGDFAYKFKKPVDFGFLDFSTLDKRKSALANELLYNQPQAPDIYLRVEEFNDEPCLVMRRFDTSMVLAEQANTTPNWRPDLNMIDLLAATLVRFHKTAKVCHDELHANNLGYVIDSNRRTIAAKADLLGVQAVTDYDAMITKAYEALKPDLQRRFDQGFVRRVHGDLHLGNILIENQKPTLFDCIEFNEKLSQLDVIYDFAFVLMDLWVRGLKSAASRLLNQYVEDSLRLGESIKSISEGIGLLPLFLSIRAAVRCHVCAHEEGGLDQAKLYLDAAMQFLQPERLQLLAIGGLSGTGKSTRAMSMAPMIGAVPGGHGPEDRYHQKTPTWLRTHRSIATRGLW